MKFFWIPKEVCYYVIVPIVLILLCYFIFYLVYKRKKGTYYYNYVVDYVYSVLGTIFCGLLLCLLLGYSIATFKLLIENGAVKTYILLDIILVILPIIPASFLVYIIIIYIRNLKRKEILDAHYDDLNIANKKDKEYKKYDNYELIKKKK